MEKKKPVTGKNPSDPKKRSKNPYADKKGAGREDKKSPEEKAAAAEKKAAAAEKKAEEKKVKEQKKKKRGRQSTSMTPIILGVVTAFITVALITGAYLAWRLFFAEDNLTKLVIRDYGKQHVDTGDLIVYTSADSVFQIAAHEALIAPEKLYEICKIAREILVGEHGVGRVIARPFKTESGKFVRTSNRHDFSLEPPCKTMLDYIKENGLDTIAVGKIYDIFAAKGISEHVFTSGNTDGMKKALEYAKKDFGGLCFINLVDFDMLYGHRNDVDGYANALTEFDKWLEDFIPLLKQDDLLIITADHGCDPAYLTSTDHSREYVPLLIYGKNVKNINCGTKKGFCTIGKTICEYLSVNADISGESILSEILK